MLNLLIYCLITIFIYMTFWFLVAIILKRNDIADVAWGLGFIVVCFVIYQKGFHNVNFLVIFALTAVWGLRLAFHVYARNKGKAEDFRYKKWRDEWGKWFYLKTYLQVFILQGFFMLLVSFSAIISASSFSSASLNLINLFGIFIWSVGFLFEALGDFQLTRFISNSNNKGKILRTGLWKYTRHPNYFGEVSQWWGIFLIAVTSNLGLLAVISPLTITYLILKVSGIPLLEKKYEGNIEFEDYKKVTNAFFPWLPKRI